LLLQIFLLFFTFFSSPTLKYQRKMRCFAFFVYLCAR